MERVLTVETINDGCDNWPRGSPVVTDWLPDGDALEEE
jgi:hypothetical protein